MLKKILFFILSTSAASGINSCGSSFFIPDECQTTKHICSFDCLCIVRDEIPQAVVKIYPKLVGIEKPEVKIMDAGAKQNAAASDSNRAESNWHRVLSSLINKCRKLPDPMDLNQ